MTPTHILAVLALSLAAVALSPPVAFALPAGKPIAPALAQPLSTTLQPANPTIGDGVIAWEDHSPNAAQVKVWTSRDGTPAAVAQLPVPAGLQAWPDPYTLEAGTDAHGNPVAIASSLSQKTRVGHFYLVRLDTGAVQRMRLQPHARHVTDIAIDAGRVFYVTTVRADTKRARSSLWTARLTGRSLRGRSHLHSSPRGEPFTSVRADRHRIAVTSERPQPDDPDSDDLPLYAGTQRGALRQIGAGSATGGGIFRTEAAGFTHDGRSVIVSTTGPESFTVQRVPLRGKLQASGAGLSTTVSPDGAASAYDPLTDRMLISFLGENDDYPLGWTAPLG